MANLDHITPPPDAPIPWGEYIPQGRYALDSRGRIVAHFDDPAAAAYAIAAANALPGLVGLADACETAMRLWADGEDPHYVLAGIKDALAALPKEPTR